MNIEVLDLEAAKAAYKHSRRIEFPALHQSHNPQGIVLRAERTGDAGIYQEISVQALKAGKPVADILVGLDEHGELRVLITSDGDGESDHAIAVYPSRPKNKMVEEFK